MKPAGCIPRTFSERQRTGCLTLKTISCEQVPACSGGKPPHTLVQGPVEAAVPPGGDYRPYNSI